MDDRIKAASMACYMSTFSIDREWVKGGRSDGEQSWPRGVNLGLDKPDLLEVRAPKATQVGARKHCLEHIKARPSNLTPALLPRSW